MHDLSQYEKFIHRYVKRFSNITSLDLSQTCDDLWGEAIVIFAQLSKEVQEGKVLPCNFITALGNQIEQRFIDLYRSARTKAGYIDRESFIENFATRTVKFSRVHFSELSKDQQALLQNIYEHPEVIGKYIPGPGINHRDLIRYLTKALGWQRKKAIEFAKTVNGNGKKTVHTSVCTAAI